MAKLSLAQNTSPEKPEITNPLFVVPEDPDYQEFKQYGLRVVGDAVSNFARDGDSVVCVGIHAGIDVEDGDYVVVERGVGAEVETAIRRLKITLKGPELWPDSTTLSHKGPAFAGDGLKIVGLVLRKIGRSRPRPSAMKSAA